MVHHLVAGIIIQSDRILLGKRAPGRAFYPNVWDVFGGHIEPGEQPVQALIRELKEELGITPTHWIHLETISESVPENNHILSHVIIVHLYCILSWSGTPVNMQPDEHLTIQWFSYAEAIQLDLAHSSYPRLFAQCLQSVDS